jgi:dihydroneopterin aldolase
MLTVSLEQMKFHAGHGTFSEEAIVGGEFLVDVYISFEASAPIVRLDQTVDYQSVYGLVKEVMLKPIPLLETLAERCIDRIKSSFPQVVRIAVKISKLTPPLGGEVGCSAVRMEKSFPGGDKPV